MNMDLSEDKKNRRMLFLINPVAGKSEVNTRIVDIIDEFVKSGFEVVVRTTQYSGEIGTIIPESAGIFDTVVVSGGDGTLNEAANAIMKCDEKNRPNLGYIPSGTVNDFAASHKIPSNPVEAAKLISGGDIKYFDTGVLGEKHFVYVAAFGVFTDVSYQTDQQLKNTFGRMAYFIEGVKRLAHIPSYKMKFECDALTEEDGKKFMKRLEIDDTFIYGMVTNSKTVGGFKLPDRDEVYLDDGLMEVTLFKTPTNLQERQQIINALLSLEADPKVVYHFQTSHIRCTSEKYVSWTTDGEFGGAYKDVELNIQRKKFAVIA